MAYRNKVSLRVCGRTVTLAGNESVEYITKVANYIDQKAAELRKSPNSKNLSPQMISVLTSINIADDYYKQIEINEQLKASMPEGYEESANKALFTQDMIDDYKIEIERLRKELQLSKQKQAELEGKLAIAENKAVLYEEDNKRKKAEIERLREFEEIFENSKAEKQAEETVVEAAIEEAETEETAGETDAEVPAAKDDEVFENQMEITIDDIPAEAEMEFPLQEEPVKAEKVKYDSHKLYNSSNNYYRQI